MNNLSGDDYEYLVLDRDLRTDVLRIHLQIGSNTKCLRAELYGCIENRFLEYQSKQFSKMLSDSSRWMNVKKISNIAAIFSNFNNEIF